MIEKFKITEENIYNFDKKKFLIVVNIILIGLITHKKLISSEIILIS